MQAGGARAQHVDFIKIADVDRSARFDTKRFERTSEDSRIGLLVTDDSRVDHDVEVVAQAELLNAGFRGAIGVTHDRHSQAELRESGQSLARARVDAGP